MTTRKKKLKNGNGNGLDIESLESIVRTGVLLAVTIAKLWESWQKMKRKKEKTIHGREIGQ